MPGILKSLLRHADMWALTFLPLACKNIYFSINNRCCLARPKFPMITVALRNDRNRNPTNSHSSFFRSRFALVGWLVGRLFFSTRSRKECSTPIIFWPPMLHRFYPHSWQKPKTRPWTVGTKEDAPLTARGHKKQETKYKKQETKSRNKIKKGCSSTRR